MTTTAPAPSRAAPAATRRRALLAGAKAMVPLALAVTPIGLTNGLAYGQLPVDHLAAWSSTWLIYAGSAQLVAVTTYAEHPAGVAAVLAAVAVNARLAFYSAAMAPRWRGLPLRRRLLAGYLLIDPSFLHAQERHTQPGTDRERFLHYLGGGAVLWLWWLTVNAVGLLAPSLVPSGDVLWAAAPLCFVAAVAHGVRTRAGAVAAGAAGAVALAAAGLPWGVGLLVAMVVGIAAAAPLARKERRS